jgi:NADH-quinone oxidoreductase subunit A
MDFVLALFVIGLAGLMVFGGLAASHLLAPRHPNAIKNSPYECGEQPIGPGWVQFKIGYYLFALLFLVFDVEAAFLYPFATILRKVGIVGLLEVTIFILVLIAALAYAWRKGALEWD